MSSLDILIVLNILLLLYIPITTIILRVDIFKIEQRLDQLEKEIKQLEKEIERGRN